MDIKTIRKFIRNIIFFIILIVLTFWILFKDQDMNKLFSIIRMAKMPYIFLGLFAMLLFFFMESYNIKSILKTFGEKISIFKAYKFTLIGFFFSAITPAASGGQPMEIYYMKKEKISGAHATMTLLMQLCGFQISTLSLGIICAIINPGILKGGLLFLFLVGITINGFALFLMLVCVFSKRLTARLIKIFIRILEFFKVKNIEKKQEDIKRGLEKYNNNSEYIKNHKKEFVICILRVFIQITLYYLVPFFVYKSFGLRDYNIFQLLQIFTMQAVLYTTVSGLPLPGAIGISESVFLGIYGVAFGKNLLQSAMLLNRGINFYSFVVISLIVVILNILINKGNNDPKGSTPFWSKGDYNV